MLNSDDRSFRYGDGLFETVRVEEDGPLGLPLHLERFESSARALGYPVGSLRDGLVELERLKQARPGIWRVTVSRDDPEAPFGGGGTVEVSFRALPSQEQPSLCALPGYYSPELVTAHHKTTSAIRYVEARRQARAAGYDDAILVTQDGVVGEATAANLFVVVNDEIVTPPVAGILPGTARRRVIEAADADHVPIVERAVTLDDLRACDEIVLTNAGILAVSAASFEGRSLDAQCAEQFRAWIRAPVVRR